MQTKEQKREYNKKWREQNREKLRSNWKRWYYDSEENKDKHKVHGRKWQRENPDKMREYATVANERFRQHVKEKDPTYWQRYYQEHFFSERCKIAKGAAKRKGLEFNLTPEFLEGIAVKTCPIFGFELEYGGGKNNPKAAALDRRDNMKGYTTDNVWFISQRANFLKSDASVEELETIVKVLRSIA